MTELTNTFTESPHRSEAIEVQPVFVPYASLPIRTPKVAF